MVYIKYIMSSNQKMFSNYHNEWAVNMRKLIFEHEKYSKKYKLINRNINREVFYKKRIKFFQGLRKIYLFVNRTKLNYFSFQPKILNFWRTISRKRNELIIEINERLIDKSYNEKEKNYLKLLKKTLEKYNPTYGLQIGLLLHVKFSKDIALVINQYLM